MSEEYEDDDECLESVLKDFVNIKNTGTPCKLTEARKFYVGMLNESKNKVTEALGMYLLNINQPIPYSKIDTEELDTIVDDGNYITETISVFNNLIPLVYDLYKHPKLYNAWKGVLKTTLDDKIVEEPAYYIELKVVETKDKAAEDLYI